MKEKEDVAGSRVPGGIGRRFVLRVEDIDAIAREPEQLLDLGPRFRRRIREVGQQAEVQVVVYVAEIYSDGENAHWRDNPFAMEIGKYLVDSNTSLRLDLAPGGGQGIRFYPASEQERATLPQYPP